jgi:hypothetical protein
MNSTAKRGLTFAAMLTTIALAAGGTSVAVGEITSKDIKDGTIKIKDLKTGTVTKLKGSQGPVGPAGPRGPAGAAGAGQGSTTGGLTGAYYSVAKYNAGDTNAGAIASVACSAESDVAISGGVQTLGLDATPLDNNTPVSSSFPGRMNYTTNTPRPNRLDGWIIQFGGNAGATSDNPPLRVNVWALCVPGTTIPVTTTYTQAPTS